MRALTHLGDAWATIGAALVVAFLGDVRLGTAMLVANALSHVPVQVLKRLVARPRPSDASGRPLALVPLADPFSFPSGHAAATTAVATTLTLAHPVTAPIVLPLAGLVSYSRFALRVHHASDVVAGVGLGLAGAFAARAWLWQRPGPIVPRSPDTRRTPPGVCCFESPPSPLRGRRLPG